MGNPDVTETAAPTQGVAPNSNRVSANPSTDPGSDLGTPSAADSGTPSGVRNEPLSAWFGVIGLLLLATLLAAVFVQVRQQALLNLTVQDQDEYSALNLFQVEVEYLRLRERLRVAAQAMPSEPSELQLRYDIFLSRTDLLHTVRARQLLGSASSSATTLGEIDAFVAHADHFFGPRQRATLDSASAQQLLAELERIGMPIHQLLVEVSHQVTSKATLRREQVKQHNRVGLALTAFLLAMLLVFAALTLHQMRQLERRRSRLQALADQLREARATAEAANAAKTVFLADMSHELRTPLHGLLGMLSLLHEAPRDARSTLWLDTARDSATHLQHLLDDVLDLSKLEAGSLVLALKPVRLVDLVQDSCALMRPQAEAKGLQLSANIDFDLPQLVQVDPTRLRQLLFNLLHNAIKYSESGTVGLRCQGVEGHDGNRRIEFCVTDTGIGMAADALAQIGQRFQRGKDPLARRQAGTGLGLAISRRLAQLMGDELHVRSTQGTGSVFSFSCPLTPVTQPPLRVAEAGSGVQPTLSVLVAEDHPVNRLYLVALLERLGHRVHHVEDGQAAVQMVQGQAFDLVLMDVQMPVMDGVTATERIRALPLPARRLRIVALTADVFTETRDRCLNAGVDEVVTKPLSRSALEELLMRQFGKVGVAAAASATETAADQAGDRSADRASEPALPSLSATPQLIDHIAQASLLDLLGQDSRRSLTDQLFAQALKSTQRLREAMRNADVDTMRQSAHAVKGAALNLGMPALAEAAATISADAQAMAAPQLALAVQRFDELVQATHAMCQAEGLSSPAK